LTSSVATGEKTVIRQEKKVSNESGGEKPFSTHGHVPRGKGRGCPFQGGDVVFEEKKMDLGGPRVVRTGSHCPQGKKKGGPKRVFSPCILNLRKGKGEGGGSCRPLLKKKMVEHVHEGGKVDSTGKTDCRGEGFVGKKRRRFVPNVWGREFCFNILGEEGGGISLDQRGKGKKTGDHQKSEEKGGRFAEVNDKALTPKKSSPQDKKVKTLPVREQKKSKSLTSEKAGNERKPCCCPKGVGEEERTALGKGGGGKERKGTFLQAAGTRTSPHGEKEGGACFFGRKRKKIGERKILEGKRRRRS